MRSSWGWIGIDLGNRAVKLAQVERVGSQLRLVHSRLLARDADDETHRPAIAWWEEVLRSDGCFDGFRGTQAACVLPASMTELRAMNLPEGSEPERRAMVGNELAASGLASRVFGFWDSHPPAAQGPTSLENVNVVSLLEEEASCVATMLEDAGVVCNVIDGLPLTLARAVQLASLAAPAKPVAAVDWGYTSATFCLLCDRRPIFTRRLRDCGFGLMAAAVRDALAVSHADAEQLLARYGFCGAQTHDGPLRDVQEVLAEIVFEPLAAMVAELDKTLSYPELHRAQVVPQQIWLFGGGATVRNVGPLLSARLGRDVLSWRMPAAEAAAPIELLGPAIALSLLGLGRMR